ncbi:MAG TPA: YfiR family protein [Caulobacteraceae bacterium]|jgi:hypothetical protein|nr:YfiR family protein [Caulobacteraceae bacterium]
MSGVRAGLAALVLAVAADQARAGTPIDAAEATDLARFAPFVDWPASAFASATSSFRLCILGDDPFGPALDQAVSGQQVQAHPMEVRRLQTADGVGACHILYVRSPRPADIAEAMTQLRGAPVLVVTDEASAPLGAIRFVVREGRVRFIIDAAAATAAGVHISSKLLSLAVRPEPAS